MEPTTPTLYQWAGGEAALQNLFRVFYQVGSLCYCEVKSEDEITNF